MKLPAEETRVLCFDSLLWLKFLLEESCHSSVCKHNHEFIHAFIIFIFFFE